MNTRASGTKLSLGVLVLGLCVTAFGQSPVITSFSQNGALICTNLVPGTMAGVEWASAATGPWTNNWAGLEAVTADSNGVIRVGVPMFFRVRGGTIPTNMVLIPAGSFTMGNCMDPAEGSAGELPLHSVYVSAFYMDPYEVTKALWDEVKLWNGGNGYSYDNPGTGKAANHPVHSICWYDVVKWCNARSQKEGLTPCYYRDAAVYKTGQVTPYVKWSANGYRLPTEAEWEKAARGGSSDHRFPWSGTDDIAQSRANYYGKPVSSGGYGYDLATDGYHPTFNDGVAPYTSPVGYFLPNGYGLYDMAGNVMEWCWDWYDTGWYSNAGATEKDTRGPVSSFSNRVLRGGDWSNSASYVRCADRFRFLPAMGRDAFGFRCVRGL